MLHCWSCWWVPKIKPTHPAHRPLLRNLSASLQPSITPPRAWTYVILDARWSGASQQRYLQQTRNMQRYEHVMALKPQRQPVMRNYHMETTMALWDKTATNSCLRHLIFVVVHHCTGVVKQQNSFDSRSVRSYLNAIWTSRSNSKHADFMHQ